MQGLIRKGPAIGFVALLTLGLLGLIKDTIRNKEEPLRITSSPAAARLVFSNGSPYQNNDNYTGLKTNKEYEFDLDGNGLSENFLIKSYEVILNRKNSFTYYGFVTDVLIKKADSYLGLLTSLPGHLLEAEEALLNPENNDKVLLINIIQGKLDNFLMYRYINGNLERVTTPDDIPPNSYGIMTRGEAHFEDVDGDNVKEMVIYSRLSPPEKKHKVDVYKIVGLEAVKTGAYEEETSEAVY